MEENLNNFDNEENTKDISSTSNEDEYVLGKGFNIDTDPYEEDKSQKLNSRKKKKRKSLVKNIIWITSIFVISIGLAFGIIFAGADFMGIGFGRGENVGMNIEMGTPASKVAEQLKDTGAVKMPLFFRLYCKFKGYDSQFKYGFYSFNTESGYEALAQMLINEGAKAESIKVTIPEGTGVHDYVKNVNGEDVTVPGIGTLLEKAGVCSKSDFLNALQNVKYDSKLLKNVNAGKTYCELEGYLFPNTYEFFAYDSEECAQLVVEKMISETEKQITEAMYKRADELGYSMNEILTMASIIQMEAGKSTDEMANVAAVFYNRLNNETEGGKLGSSPTCYYGTFHKNDDDRYDTYKIKGFPPGPLCSPGIDAIKAALYPTEDSPYLFFVTDKDGKFYYHKTYAEQQKTISKLKQGNNWIYEYFD